MRSVIVQVRCDNSMIGDDDDIDLIDLRVPKKVTNKDVKAALVKADKKLKDCGDGSYSIYDVNGHDYRTLMTLVAKNNPGWEWNELSPDVCMTII